MSKEINIVIDNSIVDEYAEYYFKQHPKAWVKPIDSPTHPSVNKWMIMKRPTMNALKQKWKDFIIWYINKLGYQNMKIEKCEMEVMTYRGLNRKFDLDNTTIKFISDGFVESGFLTDDNYTVLQKLTLMGGVDKENPRTEIKVKIL